MKTSTEIGSIANILGEEKAIESVAKTGFDAWDFSMFKMCKYDWKSETLLHSDHILAQNNYLSFARKLKQIGLDNGIVCNQSHAPFPSSCKDIRSYFKRAIECTKEAGGKICIIHPDNNKSPIENAQMYNELLPFAKECDVKIAAENMWNWDSNKDSATFAACATPESFNAHLAAVNDPYLVACLDIGHAEMKGMNTSAVEMINSLGKNLQALHIHDNDLKHDSHQIPFSMNINFEKIVNALRTANYDGYFTLEADSFLIKCPENLVYNKIKELYCSVKKLADMYDLKANNQ